MAEGTATTRRGYLRRAGLAGAALSGLAGCAGLPWEGPGTLEIQHYWTGGDGSAAVAALLEGFRERHPDVGVEENPIAGGAGENMQDIVRKRVLNGTPPSTWQAWPGANLTPYLEADVLVDIGDRVWDAEMRRAYREGPTEAARPGGQFVTVPLNIHRINNLFYRVDLLEAAGVDPASLSTPAALVDAIAKVEAETGATGLVKQTRAPWSVVQLWELAVLAEAGPGGFRDLVDGRVDRSVVRGALERTAALATHFPADAADLTWVAANERFIDGDAAFFVQGDWAAGMYRDRDGFRFGREWDQVPFPGTGGTYLHNMDSFPFPASNPSPETTAAFLRYCGSVDAQERFNPRKGAIPPRADVPADEFGPFLTRQMAEFGDASHHLPAVANGLALSPSALEDLTSAFEPFVRSWDVDATADRVLGVLGD